MPVVTIPSDYCGSGTDADSAWSILAVPGFEGYFAGGFAGNDTRQVTRFPLGALAGGIVTAVKVFFFENSHFGIDFDAFSIAPYNGTGQGNPETDVYFPTSYDAADITGIAYVTGNTDYIGGDGTYVEWDLPAQAVTDLNAALGGGMFTLCQDLDAGSTFGNNYIRLDDYTRPNPPYLEVTVEFPQANIFPGVNG